MRRRKLNELLRTWHAGTNGTLMDCVIEGMRRARGHAPTLALPVSIERALNDDGVVQWLRQDDVLGQVHQALNEPDLQKAYRATNGRKLKAEEIPHVTQLFTPRWIVELLVQNTLGRMWVEMHPDTDLTRQWKWFIPISPAPKPSDFSRWVRSIRVLDPSCGSMNFGLVAIDLLRAMYTEELDRAGQPGWPDRPSVTNAASIDASILRHNLFGVDIDGRSLDLARTAIELKTECTASKLNLFRADALMDNTFGDGFDIVVTNPPYLSARNLPKQALARLKSRYPVAARDLYACFIERSLELLAPGGRAGLLTMQSFMFTGSFEKLRRQVMSQSALETLVHLGPGVFDVGNPGTLQTVAFTLHVPRASRPCPDTITGETPVVRKIATYRLVEADDKEQALRDSLHCPLLISQEQLQNGPRGAWVYWVDPKLSEVFRSLPKLGELFPPRQGLATTDNARFVRCWWEVTLTSPDAPLRATNGKWFPYAKSGQFRRWYESPKHRVNWAEDGREIKESILSRYPYLRGKWQWVAKNSDWYFKPGVTYSYLTSGRFSARQMEAGAIFDVAGSALFPDDPLTILAILNSSVAHRLLQVINPTVNFQVGDLAQLPMPVPHDAECAAMVAEAIVIQKHLDQSDPASPDFVRPCEWGSGLQEHARELGRLRELEEQIDRRVSELYRAKHVAEPVVPASELDHVELASRWIALAVMRACAANGRGFMKVDAAGARSVLEELVQLCGHESASSISQTVGGVESFLADAFATWLTRTFQRRPPVWVLAPSVERFIVLHDYATPDVLKHVARVKVDVSAVDDGMISRLRKLSGLLADRSLQKWLEKRAT